MLDIDLQPTESPSDKQIVTGYQTLTEASKRLPRNSGRKIHSSTLWRWCRRGCHGIRLQYYRVGRTIMVTDSTLEKFFSALAKLDSEEVEKPRYQRVRQRRQTRPDRRQKSIDEATEILKRAKLID